MLHRRPLAKKGIHGISILLIFLVVIVLSVGISALIINYSQALAADGQTTYQEVHNNYKAFQVIEVSGFDGRDQALTMLTIDAKMLGDSTPIDMHHLSLSVGEEDFRTILNHRGDGAPIVNNNSGYNTWSEQEFDGLQVTEGLLDFNVDIIERSVPYDLPLDIDNDGLQDTVMICDDNGPCPGAYDGTYLRFTLSSTGTPVYAELRNADGQLIDVSSAPATLDVQRSPLSGGYGHITLAGTITFPYEIDSACTGLISSQGYLIDADLDDDGQNDYLGLNATHLLFYISGLDHSLSYALGDDLSAPPATIGGTHTVAEDQQRYGTITFAGTTTDADEIPVSATVTFRPYHLGGGYFATEHLIRSDRSRNGYIVPGDVVRFYVETYREINVDEILSIRFIYKNMDAVSKDVYVGNTFPMMEKIVLFPKP